jgi:hypothetical protein
MAVYEMKLVNEESVSAVTATPSVDVGTTRIHGGIFYRYMYNGGSVAYKGCPVVMTASTAGNTFVVTVATIDICTTAAGTREGGFVGTIHNATCAAGSYCWVATKGMLNCRPQSSAIAVAKKVKIGDGGGFVDAMEGFTDTSSTNTQQLGSFLVNHIVGTAQEAATAAATGTIKVWVR